MPSTAKNEADASTEWGCSIRGKTGEGCLHGPPGFSPITF
jgi:hypothetical protein